MAQAMSTYAPNNIADFDNSSSDNSAYMRNYLNHEAKITLKNKCNQDTRNHGHESNNYEVVAHLYALFKVNFICINV